MSFRVNTNTYVISALNNGYKRKVATDSSMAKLASGERINKAADDAAGLAISEKLKSYMRSNAASKRAAIDGISMVQTAEGGLNEINNIITRLREIAIQTSSDTLTYNERQLVQKEYEALTSELNRIALASEYNGVNLLQGYSNNGIPNQVEFQVGVKNRESIDRIAFNLNQNNSTLPALKLSTTSIDLKKNARNALEALDNSQNRINEMRANFGALGNRLRATAKNLSMSNEQTAIANSRIRDADIAYEASQLTKDRIMHEASTTVLFQANQAIRKTMKILMS